MLFDNLRINPERFRTNFESLSQIGMTENGGIHRPTFSSAHLQARKWFQEQVIESFPECVANVGNMRFEPGVFNIIPERVIISLEYRAPTTKLLDKLEKALLHLAQDKANNFDLELEIECIGKHPSATMNDQIQAYFKKAAQTLGLYAIPLTSGAVMMLNHWLLFVPQGWFLYHRSMGSAIYQKNSRRGQIASMGQTCSY
jgi:hypothetical protein